MQTEVRGQMHSQGVRRCVPRCCAATLPQTEDSGFVAATPRPCKVCRATTHNRQSSVLRPPSSERGSTLIISLIILIILMLLGVMAMNTSDTQYKLAGNLQFENMAMNNAEVAIDVAERWLENDVAARRLVANATNTLIATSAPPASGIDPLAMAWTDADSTAVTGPDGTPNDRQRYVIGYVSTNLAPTAALGTVCNDRTSAFYNALGCVNTYLITARGLGGRGAIKLVQVYYSALH